MSKYFLRLLEKISLTIAIALLFLNQNMPLSFAITGVTFCICNIVLGIIIYQNTVDRHIQEKKKKEKLLYDQLRKTPSLPNPSDQNK